MHTKGIGKIIDTVTIGSLIGLFTGGSIAFMATKIGTIQVPIKDPFDTEKISLDKAMVILMLFGCKYIWEKPLRHKITQWILDELKAHNIEVHEEMLKTVSRVSAYVATCAALQ